MNQNKGCFQVGTKHLVTHGLSRSKTYGVWSGMKSRCCNPKNPAFSNYGGRGIDVCERWMSFPNFAADMGEPEPGMTLDRIDNEKGYSPANCRWADRKTQSRNQRGVVILEANGERRALWDWSEQLGISIPTLWYRLKLGWTPDEVVNTPLVTVRKGIPRGAKLREYAARHGVQFSDESSTNQ